MFHPYDSKKRLKYTVLSHYDVKKQDSPKHTLIPPEFIGKGKVNC